MATKMAKHIALIICLTLGFGSVEAAKKPSPYMMPKKEFKKQIKTVALAPIDDLRWAQLDDGLKQIIEEEVTKKLKKKKIKVIPSSAFKNIRDRMEAQVGGYKNEQGKVVIEKVKAVREHSYRELMYRHDFDALLTMRVIRVKGIYQEGKAHWDGVKRDVKTSGDSVLKLFTGDRYSGYIYGSSVALSFFDRKDNVLFANRGGIEVLAERKGKKMVPVAREALLQKPKDVKKAVKLALKPL